MANEKTAAFIVIGNEILSGRTKDANLNYAATTLTELGINLKEAAVVADVEQDIIDTVLRFKNKYDYVFTSGGIGPTHDDITSSSIAKALNLELISDPRAVEILKKHYSHTELNAARLKMAMMPEGSELLDNPISSAPGFKIQNIFVLAGVPSIMQAMMEATKEHLVSGAKKYSKTVNVFLTEGVIAERLSAIQVKNSNVEIGSYPFIKHNKLGTAIVFRSTNIEAIDKALANYVDYIKSIAPNFEDLGLDIS